MAILRRVPKQRFVFDTSAFMNLGKSRQEIKRNIQRIIKLLSASKSANITMYTSPRTWAELRGMLERKGITENMIKILDVWIVQKAPCISEIKVPADFLIDYVGEVRERFDKGLREAEKAILRLKHEKESHAKIIGELRGSYKTVIRQGLLDSKEDLEVLLLAKELNAAIIAKDRGIKEWAKKWGIRYIDASTFDSLLKEYSK